MFVAALVLSLTPAGCEDAYSAGRDAAREIEGLYFHRNGAVVLETRLSEAIEAGEFEAVCRDPVQFGHAFSRRANLIGGGDLVRLRPIGPEFEDHKANRLASGPMDSWGVTVAGVDASGVGHLRVIDFYPLSVSGDQIAQSLTNLQQARSLVISLDAAMQGDTETALALFAALAPDAARQTRLNVETRYDYAPQPLTHPPSWTRLNDDIEIFVVVGPQTDQAGRALATLLRHSAGAVILGQTTQNAGGYVYETIRLDTGYELDLAIGGYRLGGSEGWPSHQVWPDLPTHSTREAMDEAFTRARRAADLD